MFNKLKILPLLVLLILAEMLSAQTPRIVNYGNKKTKDNLRDVCRSQDGGILSVGSAEAEAWNGYDAMLIKINHQGDSIFRKRIGSVRSDDEGLAIAEDPLGRIWIGGTSDSGQVKAAWIACRTPAGGPVWHYTLFSSSDKAQTQDLEVAADGRSMAACGIQNGKIWFARLGFDRTPIIEPFVLINAAGISALQVEKVMMAEGRDQMWYLYGCGKDSKGNMRAFFLKINGLGAFAGAIVLENQKIQQTGRCIVTTGGNLLGVGTAEVPPSQEEAFTWYVTTDFDPGKARFQSFGGRSTKGSRLDEAYDIVAIDATTCLVAGATRSHKPGAQVSNMAVWRTDHYGKRLSFDMADYGDNLEERAIRIIQMYSGDVWLCGEQNSGGKVFDDRNFAFTKIESLSLPWAGTARSGNIQFNTPSSAPAIAPGGNGTLEVEVVNAADQPAEGLFITAQCPPGMARCYAGVRFALPPLAAGEHFVAKIPLWADLEAPPTINNLKLELSNASGAVLTQKTTQLTVGALQKPALKLQKAVSATTQKAAVVSGETTVLEFYFKNEGAIAAKNVVMSFAPPAGAQLSGQTSFNITNWPVGVERVYTVRLLPGRSWRGTVLDVRVFFTGENLIDQPDLKASFEVVKEAPQPAAPTTQPAIVGPVELEAQWDDGNDALSRRSKQARYELAVALSGNQQLGYGDIWIRHNRDSFKLSGVKSDEFQLKKKNNSDKWFIYHLNADVKLVPGDNVVQVIVKKGNRRATTAAMSIHYSINPNVLHVVCVGIPDNTERLHYTQKDARDVAKLFTKQEGKLFGEVRVTLLTSPDSTRAEVISKTLNEFRLMAKRGLLRPDDAILLFFSTHGIVSEEDGAFRLLGSAFDPGNEKYTSIHFREDVLNALDTLSCHKFILLDACQSGAFHRVIGPQLRQTRIVASCAQEESSYEDDQWQNGAFTKTLKDLLGNSSVCATLDKDGKKGLSMAEIFSRLQTDVSQLVKKTRNKSQTPFAAEGVLKDGMQLWFY
jgi:Caspase domain